MLFIFEMLIVVEMIAVVSVYQRNQTGKRRSWYELLKQNKVGKDGLIVWILKEGEKSTRKYWNSLIIPSNMVEEKDSHDDMSKSRGWHLNSY